MEKTAFAVIKKIDDHYQIGIDVTNGSITSGADGWTDLAPSIEEARQLGATMLLDYCEDGECRNGGIRTEE